MKNRSKRAARTVSTPPARGGWRRWLLGGAALLGVVTALAAILSRPGGPDSAVAWARLGTQDVHSLALPGPDKTTVLFGHHGGILRSTDGGRRWEALPVRQDAMGMSAATDGSVIIAGHLVFQGSADGGATWAPISADLPNLDIHSFARSLSDPSRMWAYLAEGGVYESTDGGQRWTKVYDGHVSNLTAIRVGERDLLLGIEALQGLVRSEDGGASWAPVGVPPVAPVTNLASTPDGQVLVVGGVDGLYRSDDAGSTWEQILRSEPVLAAALWVDGSTIVAVDRETLFYRSDDGGTTWASP